MTPIEALELLRKAAFRNHEKRMERFGPSHGDPGGDLIYVRPGTCAALSYSFGTITGIDESKCDCRAKRHNEVVAECVEILRKEIG